MGRLLVSVRGAVCEKLEGNGRFGEIKNEIIKGLI